MSTQIVERIMNLEDTMKRMPGALVGDDAGVLRHSFADGQYVRELSVPAGSLIVTKIHKKSHPVFILTGDCSVLTEDGIQHIKAPYHMITKAGTKRIVYVHADTVWVTVHATTEKDLQKIEDEVIAKTFDDVPNNIIDVDAEVLDFIEAVKKENADGTNAFTQ